MTFKKLFIAGAAALCLASSVCGCVTNGQRFSMAQVAQLKPGVTTFEEAVAMLGKPAAFSDIGSGQLLVQWVFSEVVLYAGEGRHVAILFDKDRKMIKVTHVSETKF